MGMYAALFTLHILLLRFFIQKFASREMHLYNNDPASPNNLRSYF